VLIVLTFRFFLSRIYCLTISCSCYAVVNLRFSFKRRAFSCEKASCLKDSLNIISSSQKIVKRFWNYFLTFFREIPKIFPHVISWFFNASGHKI